MLFFLGIFYNGYRISTSGMLCKAMAKARLTPTRMPFIDPRNTAIPSGKLCKLMPIVQSQNDKKYMKSLEKHLFCI
jgi:hypothetical protein